MTRIPSRTLLLTLDAFGTIFHPRLPVPDQYAATAHAFNLPQSLITSDSLQKAFKPAFKAQSAARPNYGRDDVLRGTYGGPRQWWEEVIRASFAGAMNTDPNTLTLPDGLIERLLDRFASDEGYALCVGAMPFFEKMREVKRAQIQGRGGGRGLAGFDRVFVGVVSNSDDRIPAVLKSLGLRVGDLRADQGVSSMRLPGFEERSISASASAYKDGDGVNDLDLIITSYEAGEEKPSRLIFDIAKRQAQKLVGQSDSVDDWVCVHVGDEYVKDYRAAVDAGWDSYYLPRGDEDSPPEGVKTITSLVDLFPILERYP